MNKLIILKGIVDESKRKITAIASDQNPDRDNDQIMLSAWDTTNFEKNPVILLNHDSRGLPIARATKVKKDFNTGQLLMDIEFPSVDTYALSDTVFRLVKNGFMSALSVGFLGKSWEDRTDKQGYKIGKKYTSVELYEVSLVTVPANAGALVIARDAGIISTKEFKVMKSFEGNIEIDLDSIVFPSKDDIGFEITPKELKNLVDNKIDEKLKKYGLKS